MSFRLVPKSLTLNDLEQVERRNGPSFELIFFWVHCVKVVDKAINGQFYDYYV